MLSNPSAYPNVLENATESALTVVFSPSLLWYYTVYWTVSNIGVKSSLIGNLVLSSRPKCSKNLKVAREGIEKLKISVLPYL